MKGAKGRILAIDDDKDILELLRYNLEKEGFQVKTMKDSRSVVRTALKYKPDLIILDIMMPGKSGFDVCQELRNNTAFESTYIFFLTAKTEHEFENQALNHGGDDYIEKFMGLRALVNKITSVLTQRYVIRKNVKQIEVGDVVIDREQMAVTKGKRKHRLSEKEFELLYFMAQNSNKTISGQNLLQNIWGSDIYMMTKNVDSYVENIRKKIGNIIIKNNDSDYRLNTGKRYKSAQS